MESAGHVTRRRDPEDERQVRVRLTQRGRSVREKVSGSRGGLLKATGLTPEGLSRLREEVVKLRENLSKAARATD
jgi:DNA-binding MarR family transcriptional regulator